MDRTELLSQVSSAASLNQISSVIAGIRAWLAEHPDDDDMHQAFREITRLERERWTYSTS
jgi:hypothetical protein